MQQSQEPCAQLPGLNILGSNRAPSTPLASKGVQTHGSDTASEAGLRGAAIDLVDCPVWDLMTPAAFASLGWIP